MVDIDAPKSPGANGKTSRIPLTLQAVFLASNRGGEVHKPPPNQVANKEYARFGLGLIWKNNPDNKKKKKKSSNDKKKKKKKKWLSVSGWGKSRRGGKRNRGTTVGKGTPGATLSTLSEHGVADRSTAETTENTDSPAELSPKITAVVAPPANAVPPIPSVVSGKPESAWIPPPLLPAAQAGGAQPTSTPSKRPPPPKNLSNGPAVLTPHQLMNAMISARGYSTKTFDTLQTAYFNKPTELQQASYDANLIMLVKFGTLEQFKDVMSCGLSTNPCNQHGESLVHMLARRGDAARLKILIGLGCSLQVSDDYGRTPLHDACWTPQPCFDVVELIIKADRRLFHMKDCRGATPLAYARQCNWAAWVNFIESRKNVYWPMRDIVAFGLETDPPLCGLRPNTKPIRNPKNALSTTAASLVAKGKVTPKEVAILFDMSKDDDEEISEYSHHDALHCSYADFDGLAGDGSEGSYDEEGSDSDGDDTYYSSGDDDDDDYTFDSTDDDSSSCSSYASTYAGSEISDMDALAQELELLNMRYSSAKAH